VGKHADLLACLLLNLVDDVSLIAFNRAQLPLWREIQRLQPSISSQFSEVFDQRFVY
jgi:hypothetical protein